MAKTINTRIQLKYDSLANWQTNNPTLLAGEIAIATLGNSHTTTTPDNGTHPVVFKVGPGAYNDLPFTSALAADVYAWAKQDKLTITKNGTGNVVAGIEWDATANEGKGGIKFTTASVATAEGFEELQEAVNAINEELETYGDIVTHNASEFATAAQGTKADNAAVKTEVDAALLLKADKSVVDAMYSNSKIDELVAGAKSGAEATAASALATARTEITAEIGTAIAPLATTEALNGVKATAEQGVANAATAQAKADDVEDTLNKFLDGITPDGSDAIKDTLKEISDYITEDTAAFTALSGRVTTAEGDIDTLEGKVSTLEGLVGENGKVENAENADTAAGYTEGGAIDTAIKAAAAAGTTAASNVQTGVENGTIKAGEAKKVSNSLTITGDGVTETTFDGSEAKTVTIDLSGYQEKGNYQPAGNYKTVQTTVEAKGSATKLLTVSQNTNGEVTLAEHDLSIKNVVEATDHTTVVEDKDYIIFNCGSSSVNV